MSLRVRPVVEADRSLLLDLRNAPRVREVSVNDHVIDADEHDGWFDRMIRDGHRGFRIVVDGDRPVGVLRVDPVADDVAAWSCHSATDGMGPGVGAALPVLALGLGFGSLGNRRMVAEVLSNNKNMLGIHRRLRVPQEGLRRAHVARQAGVLLDVHEYGVLAEEWPAIRDRLLELIPASVGVSVRSCLDALDGSGRNDH